MLAKAPVEGKGKAGKVEEVEEEESQEARTVHCPVA
jgi:hypothetical protein